tara:strand:- start:1511 stop:2422 length:912 start_codon:yes stop_codon:yes gene_type:complete
MDFFFDPAIKRKSAHISSALSRNTHGRAPLPGVVEVSESGTCNRKCSFCPRSDPNYPDIKEFIAPALLHKLSAELGELGFGGIFLFSGFVEPLLDKNIYQHIRTVSSNIPNARVEMVTNGDVLNEARLLKLFENGLTTLLISVYDSAEDAERFEQMCIKADLSEHQFVIRHRYLPPEEDFGITLSNRAGAMSNAEFVIDDAVEPLREPCFYPSYTFFMDYNGDVLLCPHDWKKAKVVGNLTDQSFSEIWLGKGFMGARKSLKCGDRTKAPCQRCDVKGTLIGKEHADAWEKLSENTEPQNSNA